MTNMIIRRVGWSLLVIWFVITATFLMTVALPADPAKTMLGPQATADSLARVTERYCFDDSIVVQYGCWVNNLVHGDLGESYRTRRPVTELIGDRIWPTLQLAFAGVALALIGGIFLGAIAAYRRGRWPDRAITGATLILQSTPPFVLGAVLLYVVAYRWDLLPLGGYGEGVIDRIAHLILPATTLALGGLAYYARVARTELVDVLREDYVRTARSKGLAERDVLLRHALRPALPPLVTLAAMDLGVLAGGAVVIESVFRWPGLGRELLQAILDVDMPVIVGITLVTAIAVVVVTLIADLIQVWLDPRLRVPATPHS